VSVWAVLPAKSLAEGKSRLEAELSLAQRTELNFDFFVNSAGALLKVPSVEGLCVVSRDRRVLLEAERLGALSVEEEGADLNLALDQARSVLGARDIHQILIMPADLPLVRPSCIEEIMGRRRTGPQVILVPDRRMEGTNLLYLDPAEDFEFSFGEGSFEKHRRQATQRGRKVDVVLSEELAFDVDTPEDLDWLRKKWTASPFSKEK
jgi:2-phospho-L-lactate guanylyltransferase